MNDSLRLLFLLDAVEAESWLIFPDGWVTGHRNSGSVTPVYALFK